AAEAARGCERFLARGLESLRMSVRMLPVAELSREELRTVLGIPLRQLEFVQALAIFDDHGALLAAPVSGASDDHGEEDRAAARRFVAAVPLHSTLKGDAAVGVPYRTTAGPRVAVAVHVPEKHVVLAAEVAFGEMAENIRQISGGGLAVL